MRQLTTIMLLLSVQLASAQRAAERSAVPRPTVGGISGPIYKDAYATPDPEGPTIHCADSGVKCVVDARLLTATRATPAHDTALQGATAAINRILASLTPRADRKLCLYRSIHGPVLLWAKAEAAPGQPSLDRPHLWAAPRRVTDPQAIADLLGLRPSARSAAGNRKAELVWNEDIKAYVWKCVNPGSDCVIHQLTTTASRTASHDEPLMKATAEINRILEETSAKAPRREQRLCILFTPDGPMLAWTFAEEVSGKTISSDDPNFSRAARESLGLVVRGN